MTAIFERLCWPDLGSGLDLSSRSFGGSHLLTRQKSLVPRCELFVLAWCAITVQNLIVLHVCSELEDLLPLTFRMLRTYYA